MKKIIIANVFIFFCIFSLCGQEDSNAVKIKIKRTYLNDKIKSEDYYDQQGRLVKSVIIDFTKFFHTGILKYDSLVTIYKYRKRPPQEKTYSYDVYNSKRSRVVLDGKYYYKNGLLVKEKAYHGCLILGVELFWYNEYGDLIKEKADGEIYLTDYIYTSDSLIQEEIEYENNRHYLLYRREYEYNSFKKIEKIYRYNYDNRLTEIILYEYDEKQRLIKVEATNLNIYTAAHQRRETKHIVFYKYNDYDLVIEESSFEDFMNESGNKRTFRYEYEYY